VFPLQLYVVKHVMTLTVECSAVSAKNTRGRLKRSECPRARYFLLSHNLNNMMMMPTTRMCSTMANRNTQHVYFVMRPCFNLAVVGIGMKETVSESITSTNKPKKEKKLIYTK
jgi:hypothetical protein